MKRNVTKNLNIFFDMTYQNSWTLEIGLLTLDFGVQSPASNTCVKSSGIPVCPLVQFVRFLSLLNLEMLIFKKSNLGNEVVSLDTNEPFLFIKDFLASSSTDNFGPPIAFSDWLIFCCGNFILRQKKKSK